jgi:hypothetical protein
MMTSDKTFLCVLRESEGVRFDLHRDGEKFILRDHRGRKPDRTYESLPALMKGLETFFVELRAAKSPLKGFGALKAAQDTARTEVIAASRIIHKALEE